LLDLNTTLDFLNVHLTNNRSSTLQELRTRFGLIPGDLIDEGINEMMDIIFPPGHRGRSRPSTPSGPSTSPTNVPWQTESSNTPMTISPVASQEVSFDLGIVWHSESRDNYEFHLLEDNLEIPLVYFTENGEFPTTDRPNSNVPPLYKDEKSIREFNRYVSMNEVRIFILFGY
jgi:hypothetical protein